MTCRKVMRSLMVGLSLRALLIAADETSGQADMGQGVVTETETRRRVQVALDLLKEHDPVMHQNLHSVLMSAMTYLPKRIEQFEQQINETTRVLGGKIVEIMNEGVLDIGAVEAVMETLIEQLLGANGHLDWINVEVTKNLVEFNTSSQDKNANTLKALIAFEKNKMASLKRQADFYQVLYDMVNSFCRPEKSEAVLRVILTVVCFLLTCCAGCQLPTGKVSKVLLGILFISSILAPAWLMSHKNETLGHGPEPRRLFEEKNYEKDEQVKLLEKLVENMDSLFFNFFTDLTKSIDNLHGHSITLKDQKEQIKLSKAGKIHCAGYSVAELGQFLQKNAQNKTAIEIFHNKRVNGAYFMDETIVTTKVLTDWGLESFDVAKLRALRGRCKSNTGLGNEAAKKLAAAVTETLENVKKDAAQLRPLLSVPQ